MKLRAWNTKPNVLVARIVGNEPQLENSTTSALRQRDVNVDFLEVPAGRIKDAHEELYKRLASARESYDVIVKVDPDMELVSSHLFRRTHEWLISNPGVLDLQIGVHDYFTDWIIPGLHAFRPNMRWPQEQHAVFTDIGLAPESAVHYDREVLAPAAYHCQNPSETQAVRFGIHRGIKLIVALRLKERKRAAYHGGNLERLLSVIERDYSWERYLAIRGYWLALSTPLGSEHLPGLIELSCHVCNAVQFERDDVSIREAVVRNTNGWLVKTGLSNSSGPNNLGRLSRAPKLHTKSKRVAVG